MMIDPLANNDEALSIFAEATQDLVTAGLEQSLGRTFACADSCNQSAEKSLQSIHVARYGRRAPFDHDLRRLGTLVDTPVECLDALEALTPYHPETFYTHTAPELADDAVLPEEAAACIQRARMVQRWARDIVVGPKQLGSW